MTFIAPSSGAGGTFSGGLTTATVTTNSSGVVTSPVFTANGTAGSYSVIASLGASLPSAVYNLANTKADQAITFGPIPSKTYGDPPFALAASASSGLAVSLQILSGPATLSGNTLTITGTGTVTVRASQPGDGNYFAATPVDQSFTVAKANQTITFPALGNKTFGDGDFTVSATTTATGLNVSFAASGQCSVSGSIVHITGVGSCTITASQAGDGNFNAATSVNQSFTVDKATATLTLSNLTQIYDGTAKAATVATDPSGLSVTVSYSQNSSSIASPITASAYNVTATLPIPTIKAAPQVYWSSTRPHL